MRFLSVTFCMTALAAVLLAAWVSPVQAEYDIFTRYQFSRPEGDRHFYLYSPTHYTQSSSPSPLPLALFFHGWTDTCEQWISQFSVFALAAELSQYHLGVMCGTLNAQGAGPGWNSGFFLGNESIVPDDVAYARIAAATIAQAVKVQPGRVFAMGHSNGAFMSELLACNASDLVAAIVSNAGSTMLDPDPKKSIALCDTAYGSHSTSVLLIHGTADGAVPYNGSAHQAGVREDLQAWGRRNRCKGDPMHHWTRGVASSEGWAMADCADGKTAVELVTIDGGVHMVNTQPGC